MPLRPRPSFGRKQPLFAPVYQELRQLFSDATVRERMWLATLLMILFSCFVCVAVWFADVVFSFVPVHQTVVVDHVTREVQHITRMIHWVPPKITYKPLANPKDACHGSPVYIVHKFESGSNNDQDKMIYTWMTVRPAGDEYEVACYKEGAYSFEEGDLVSLVGGKVTAGQD